MVVTRAAEVLLISFTPMGGVCGEGAFLAPSTLGLGAGAMKVKGSLYLYVRLSSFFVPHGFSSQELSRPIFTGGLLLSCFCGDTAL